jgi:4-alpha-glucanotransferase
MELTPEKKIAGLLAPLFAIRSETDLGVGDTQSLRQFVDWAADAGFRLVQLLPINETGADNSPYMAVSSVALEPSSIHISATAIRDLTAAEIKKTTSGVDAAALHGTNVNYRVVKSLKLRLLKQAFENFEKKSRVRKTARTKDFEAFIEKEAAWLDGYALFRVLMDENGVGEKWDEWPEKQRTFASAKKWLAALTAQKCNTIEHKARFYKYVQWTAFSQWRALKDYCDTKRVALMGDVPFGVSYYSADVWSEPEIFDLTWSGGAPPEKVFKSDPFTEKWGQNWGIPLYRWSKMQHDDYRWWRRRVRMVREMFHLFRIDHILGFYRLYSFPWRPDHNGDFLPLTLEQARAKAGGRLPGFLLHNDDTQHNRDANCNAGAGYLKVLLEEVGEHRLIGEDLGIVPPYVRPNLSSLGIAGFKIPQWERTHDNKLAPGCDYQRLSVTTWATHDHPPLRTMWEEHFAASQNGNGGARWELQILPWFCGTHLDNPKPWGDDVHEMLLRGLFISNSWIAIVMITDLLGSTQRFNVPGAIADANWSARLSQTARAMSRDAAVVEKVARVKRMIRESGRA